MYLTQFKKKYIYLENDIYPKFSTLVKTFRNSLGPKHKLFAITQESCKKDVQRAFGVLQSRFAVTAGPSRFWTKSVSELIRSFLYVIR